MAEFNANVRIYCFAILTVTSIAITFTDLHRKNISMCFHNTLAIIQDINYKPNIPHAGKNILYILLNFIHIYRGK